MGNRKGTNEKLRRMIDGENKRRLVIYIGIAVIVILAAILVIAGVRHFGNKKADTSEGLALIKKAEQTDVTAVETKIESLEAKERQESGEEDSRSLKEIFTSTVVMGDSITQGFTDYDVLNASSVVSQIGVELTQLDKQVAKMKELNPQVVFLSYGMNDIIATQGNTDTFISEYKALIRKIQKELPDTKIFINSIFPVQQQAVDSQPLFAGLDSYNQALQEMCDDEQLAFVDNSSLVSEQYYESDGVHFQAGFYPIWGKHMAEVAAL